MLYCRNENNILFDSTNGYNGSKNEIEEATYRILEATENRKHIVAASDYLFYDIPAENVKAMAGIVNGLI